MGVFDLFKPAWQSENKEKALKAVCKMNDQATLADVAKNALPQEVRVEAIKKLTDQKILLEIALYDPAAAVRFAAADKITDQSLVQEMYADFIKKSTTALATNSRVFAITRLTDQSVLFDFARNNPDSFVRIAAVQTMTDKALIEDIALKGVDWDVCRAAVNGLIDDQERLIHIAENALNGNVRLLAFEKLLNQTEDQNWIASLVRKNMQDHRWLDSAMNKIKITDQSILADFAKHSPHGTQRIRIVKKLTDRTVVESIAQNDEVKDVQEAARKRLAELQ